MSAEPEERPGITPAPTLLQAAIQRRSIPEVYNERIADVGPVPQPAYTTADNIIATVYEKTKVAVLVASLVPHLFTLFTGMAMRNWRTTIAALIGALALLLAHWNIVIPHEWIEPIVAVTMVVVGLVSKDAKVSGLPDEQTVGR